MIKPTSLWALFKGCTDSRWLGDICRHLGGQDGIELDFGQKQMIEVIKRDNGWMDERIEARRELARERKARQRAKEKADNIGQDETSHDCHAEDGLVPCHAKLGWMDDNIPSVHPSIHPSIQNNNMSERGGEAPTPAPEMARMDVPDERTVVAAATGMMGVPDWYAKWWYREMTARDWTKTDGARISNRNWRPCLKSWWGHATESEREAIRREAASATRVDVARRYDRIEDWLLCAERCANCSGAGCTAGVTVPPDRGEPPKPPEECGKFCPIKNLAEAKAKAARRSSAA